MRTGGRPSRLRSREESAGKFSRSKAQADISGGSSGAFLSGGEPTTPTATGQLPTTAMSGGSGESRALKRRCRGHHRQAGSSLTASILARFPTGSRFPFIPTGPRSAPMAADPARKAPEIRALGLISRRHRPAVLRQRRCGASPPPHLPRVGPLALLSPSIGLSETAWPARVPVEDVLHRLHRPGCWPVSPSQARAASATASGWRPGPHSPTRLWPRHLRRRLSPRPAVPLPP